MKNIFKLPQVTSENESAILAQLADNYKDLTHTRDVDSIKLTFSEPVTLHYSTRMRYDKTQATHEVKSLFFDTFGAYYMPKRMRRGGFGLNLRRLESVEVVRLSDVKRDYTKQWQAIANSMRKYGINPDVADDIEAHLQGREEKINGFQNYWKRTDKPRTMSFADVLKSVTGRPTMPTEMTPLREWNKIISDHIKDNALEKMKERVTPRPDGEWSYSKAWKNGQKRDKSVSMAISKEGKVNYTAASEYSGCGNGDYYMMYSPTMAFYAETD